MPSMLSRTSETERGGTPPPRSGSAGREVPGGAGRPADRRPPGRRSRAVGQHPAPVRGGSTGRGAGWPPTLTQSCARAQAAGGAPRAHAFEVLLQTLERRPTQLEVGGAVERCGVSMASRSRSGGRVRRRLRQTRGNFERPRAEVDPLIVLDRPARFQSESASGPPAHRGRGRRRRQGPSLARPDCELEAVNEQDPRLRPACARRSLPTRSDSISTRGPSSAALDRGSIRAPRRGGCPRSRRCVSRCALLTTDAAIGEFHA